MMEDCRIPENIIKTEDGRLVLVGGRHHILKLFSANGPGVPKENLDNFLANHFTRSRWCSDRGINFSQWVFPDPITFKGVMPARTIASPFLRAFPDNPPEGVFYPIEAIDERLERQSLTDTHYSPIGYLHLAAWVAKGMIDHHDPAMLERLEKESVQVDNFIGDLGVQCEPAVSEKQRRPPQISAIRTATNGVRAGNNGIVQLMTSDEGLRDRTLLIFGDSFFKLMLNELARYWRRIIFLRTPYFHEEMVAAIAPDDIVAGMAERYFASAERDVKRPHFLAYPLTLGRAIDPDESFAEMWAELVDQTRLWRSQDS